MKRVKVFRNVIIIIIAALIVLGALPARSTDTGQPSAWAETGVRRAVSLGLVPASLRTCYTAPATRVEFCAVAVRVYEIASGNSIILRKAFSDSNDLNVQKMGGLGVVNGKGNYSFAPDDWLTRQEAATIISRMMEHLNVPLIANPPEFADNADIAVWALAAVGQMQAAGIMNGTGDNRFSPQEPYSIEQVIVTLLNVYDLAIDVKFEEIADAPVPLAGFFDLDESSDLKLLAMEVMELVNTERAKAGLAPLIGMELLNAAASVRAAECESLYSHTRPDGRRFDTVMEDLNISSRGRGENLDAGMVSAQAVVQRWIDSQTHKECMFEPVWEKVGAGVHRGTDGTLFWAVLFMA